MNESELKEKYMNYSDEDLEDALKKDISEEERKYIKKLLEKRKEEFEHFNSSPVNNNVAIVFDIDETLVCRGGLAKSNQQSLVESKWVLARPGLFELLDGLKEMKRKYEQENPGKEFNVYTFTSAGKIGSDAFKNFLGEDYCTLFKEFYHSQSEFKEFHHYEPNIYIPCKPLCFLPEDTILYFGDDGHCIFNDFVICEKRENQGIITFDIPAFKTDRYRLALTYREYNRHLYKKIQELIEAHHPAAVQYKETLDLLSSELLIFFDEIKAEGRIDIILDTIFSQLQGKNNDEVVSSSNGNFVWKKLKIPSNMDYLKEDILKEKYFSLFSQIYGEDAEKERVRIYRECYSVADMYHENPFEDPEVRAKYHPAEIYPHSKRYMNDDFGDL